MTVTLRHNQLGAADAVEDAFRAGIRRPLVDSCVGSGKSLFFAELARREIERGGRALIVADRKELVEQNAKACRSLGLQTGINAAKVGERTWRAPVISAAIQSIFRNAQSFGPISLLLPDEAHTWPHVEGGMYRQLLRALEQFGPIRIAGASGTVFRLQGGSLVEGEGAPFDKVVYRYSIIDGIRDGYLVPAFSAQGISDKMDVSKLRVRAGEYTEGSQDAQMIAMMDSHIMQIINEKGSRRKGLFFESSVKAVQAMTARLNEFGITARGVWGSMDEAERDATIKAFAAGQFEALVNKDICTTGFDDPAIDYLVMRFKTKSLGKYIQVTGRLLRTIGGNIEASIRAGKPDGLVFDFGGNIDDHGPLDFIRPKDTKITMVSCDGCGARNSRAAARCWACDGVMTKNCPKCLEPVAKGTLDCPHDGCGYDMRTGGAGEARPAAKLLETPSGAALIASYKTGSARDGGWVPIVRVWDTDSAVTIATPDGLRYDLTGTLSYHARAARWLRAEGDQVIALLMPNGLSRTVALQVTADGTQLPVPMPPVLVS